MIQLDVLDLVSSIYDAAFDSDLWSATLLRITDLIGGAQVMMGVHDFERKSLRVVAPRMCPEHMKSYVEQWGASDILWQRTNSVPVGTIFQAEQFVARDELKLTGIYNEWYRPMHLGVSGIGVNLPTANGLPAVCGIKRSIGDDCFSDKDIGIFTVLAPHLIRAAEINQRLWDLNLTEAFVDGRIDSRRQGVIVVDANLRIVFSNEIAVRLMQDNGGLVLDSGTLSACDQQTAGVLQRLVQSCVSVSTIERGGSVTVCRAQGAPLKLLITPFPDRKRSVNKLWHLSGVPVAIILVSDPERQRRFVVRQLQEHFDLTAAEAYLAIEIIKGDGREAAAVRLGITAGTARIHLQRVFHKTGVRRQAELVRAILDLVGDGFA